MESTHWQMETGALCYAWQTFIKELLDLMR